MLRFDRPEEYGNVYQILPTPEAQDSSAGRSSLALVLCLDSLCYGQGIREQWVEPGHLRSLGEKWTHSDASPSELTGQIISSQGQMKEGTAFREFACLPSMEVGGVGTGITTTRGRSSSAGCREHRGSSFASLDASPFHCSIFPSTAHLGSHRRPPACPAKVSI